MLLAVCEIMTAFLNKNLASDHGAKINNLVLKLNILIPNFKGSLWTFL